MDPRSTDNIFEHCKAQIDRIPCYMSPEVCDKGRVLLWEKCVLAFLRDPHTTTPSPGLGRETDPNIDAKSSTCSADKGGGVAT